MTNTLSATLQAQQAACLREPCPDAAVRKDRLRALKRQLHRYQHLFIEAIDRDFGGRAHFESMMLDILPVTLDINHCILHLRDWMKPSKRKTELLFLTNSLHVRYQPKGVVGIIATWNFPLYLSLGPLVMALAAGNRVMLKMPPNMEATTATLRQMLAEIFPEHLVAVFGAEIADPNEFSSLPFDHLIFTGSPSVGKLVMAQAAKNLVPVTLELGGKSPAIVLDDYPIAAAAKRIAHGSMINAGQICVAPDYALVPQAKLDDFVAAVADSARRLFGEQGSNPEYTAVSSTRHLARLRQLLDDARAKGAKVTVCGSPGPGTQMPLHIVSGLTPDMQLMQEEIFGPILPVLGYGSLDAALAHVARGSRPLALYAFSHNKKALQQVLDHSISGGVTINDWGWHVVNHDAPFGGSGHSGMGNYHGHEGFRELSHARTVFHRHRFFPIDLFYPPYGNIVQKLALALFIGKADKNVRKPF